jgi:hypothetical protein
MRLVEVQVVRHRLGRTPTGRRSASRRSRAALQNLTDDTDALTATSTAKMIGSPITDVELEDGHTPVRTVLLGVASLTFAVLVELAPTSLIGVTDAGSPRSGELVRGRGFRAVAPAGGISSGWPLLRRTVRWRSPGLLTQAQAGPVLPARTP